MNPPTALARLAHYAGGAPGIAEALYPATGRVPKLPGLVLFWDETPITEAGGSEQYWLMTVKGHLFVALKGSTEKEIARADGLIAPLVDVFKPGTDARTLLDPSTGDRVSHCRVERVRPTQEIGYGGHQHYGAEIYFGIKLRRFAGHE